MAKRSAALLLYKITEKNVIEVLIVHPGGPFWAKKDDGAWSVPKGEYEEGEAPRDVAYREFEEEIGISCPSGELIELGELKQPSGKRVVCWALQCNDLDISNTRSNMFEMEWPRGSGRMQSFPEVDKVAWFPLSHARLKLLKGHLGFLDRLMEVLSAHGADKPSEGDTSRPASQGELF